MSASENWYEIHGLQSLGEYKRFKFYIESQIETGSVVELPLRQDYQKGMVYGGRFFKDLESGATWRLVG